MRHQRRAGAVLGVAALLAPVVACWPRAPTLATAIQAAGAPTPDARRVATPPWARLAGMWGRYPINHGAIEAVGFAGNDRLVTLSENGGSLRVWDVRSRALIVEYERCEMPNVGTNRGPGGLDRYRLALSADGRLAAVAHGNGDVCVRRLDDGAIVTRLNAGPSALRHLGLVGTTHVLTYTHELPEPMTSLVPLFDENTPPPPPDGLLRVWDLAGRLVAEQHVGEVPSDQRARAAIAATPDGTRVAVPRGNELVAFDLPALRPAWSRRLAGPIWRVGFSSGDRFLVETASPGPPQSPRIVQLALADGRELGAADVPSFDLVALDPRGPGAVVREATRPGSDALPFAEVQLWNVPRMRLVRSATAQPARDGCREGPLPRGEGTFSPDGSVLATAGAGVTLWDVERLAPIPAGPGHCESVSQVAISPDGSRALSAGNDETVRLWRVADGTELRRWSRRATVIAFSPDGARVLLGDTTLALLDAETGRVVWEIPDQRSPAAFSPDGSLIATVGSANDLAMRATATGRPLWTLAPGMYGTSILIFTADGGQIVTTDEAFQLVVRDTKTGRPLRTLGRYRPQGAAMRPDGVLVFQEGHDVVMLPVDGSPATVRERTSLGDAGFVLTPDGAQAFVLARSRVILTRLTDGADLGSVDLRAFDDVAYGLALSRDGRRLLIGTQRGVILSFELR
jgi:WD40 repeat protein